MTEIAITWWCIWNQRNKILFDQVSISNPTEIEAITKTMIKIWKVANKMECQSKFQENNQRAKTKEREKRNMRWQPPPPNFVKVNFDDPVRQDGSATMGFIIRNNKGELIHADVEDGRGFFPVLAEAMALRLGISEAAKLGFLHIQLEGDSLIVINTVPGCMTCPWEIDLVVAEFRDSTALFEEVQIWYVFWEANSAVDKSAALRPDGIFYTPTCTLPYNT